jgi:phage gp37-like protein
MSSRYRPRTVKSNVGFWFDAVQDTSVAFCEAQSLTIIVQARTGGAGRTAISYTALLAKVKNLYGSRLPQAIPAESKSNRRLVN